jgi:uncharacterized protein (DUF885 family)
MENRHRLIAARPIGWLALAIVALMLLGGARTPNRDAAFRTLVNQFIDAEMRLFPESATAAGDHRFDGRLSDLSSAGIARMVAHARLWKARFQRFGSTGLSAHNEADREWLIAYADGELLWNVEVQTYRRDPGAYLPTAAIQGLLERDFAPLAQRMRSVTSREHAALANLAAARANLAPAMVPPVYVRITLEQLPATMEFFRHEVPAAFATLSDDSAKRAFIAANQQLLAAIGDYGRWLRRLQPTATGSFALGPDAYRRMLADDDMIDLPLDRLEAVGEAELARVRGEFTRVAAQIDPHHDPGQVYRAISRNHPPAAQVIPEVGASLSALRDFVISHHIVSMPPLPGNSSGPIVRETPPFMRATTFASMDAPGPLEKSPQAYYYVTLPDPSWPKARQEQLLEFFWPPSISDTSVHEVYPGHYVQFLHDRDIPDLVRTLFYSGANVEGWAFYCEEMMLDQGLHAGHPEFRLAQLQMALLRACRYLVGLRMHTQGMTVEQASAFFAANAYMPHNNAMMEALRGTEDPGYLRYQLGKLMILKLRADVREREGRAFDLQKFHDAFLHEGGLPIGLIRRAMLGPDSGDAL